MALYCEHPVDIGKEAKHIGNIHRGNSDSHIGEHDGLCGQEIEGMFDDYCLKHMDTYKCETCNHTPDDHDNPETQEREYCHETDCKCLEYVGEV